MKKSFWLLSITILLNTVSAWAQSGFSFHCAKDTIINGCGTVCITLKAKVPDIRANSGSYVVNPMSGTGECFAPYVSPSTPGNPTSLTIDDTYSSAINIGFSFPFYGSNYTSLLASTNGYLCFDISKAGMFSHYSTSSGDLPNTTYDKAVIMGPYHDLDPAYSTSPTQRIKYDVLGTAPHRKWILSFYKVPLFSSSCQNLIENTHQIVLYEGLGIVEVFIMDKQICTGWNNGEALVGMQNFNRNAAIMAPGRKVSSGQWGSIGMNESWRFTPATGAPLYRQSQLYTLAGTLVANGDTTRLANNVFQLSFPNVCLNNNTTYVVKTTYQDINNPAAFVYSNDTIQVIKNGSLQLAAAVTNLSCNGSNNGSIALTPAGGSGTYQYSINGGVTYQASNVFNGLANGTYAVRVLDVPSACTKDSSISITQPTALLASVATSNASCSSTPNGNITVTATGGTAPFSYSVDGTNFQLSNQFTVNSGNYTVTVKDANNCLKTIPAAVSFTDNLVIQGRTDTTICSGVPVQLFLNGNANTFSWSPSSSLNSGSIQNPIATPLVTTRYIVTASLGTCVRYDTVNIVVNQNLFVNAGADVFVIAGDEVQLNATTTSPGTYLWTPATGLNNANILNPIAKPTSTTLYTLTAKNAAGCIASDQVLVTFIPYCIKVRNAFTPNGDGNNDVWKVYQQFDCLKNITVKVFNRYGSIVYESSNYRNSWDGRYNNKALPDGTYYAIINFELINGKGLNFKTDLTILR